MACGVEAIKMLCVTEIRNSNNPGGWAWTIPLVRLMNLHIVNCTKLCPIRMSEDAMVDDNVGIALRRAQAILFSVAITASPMLGSAKPSGHVAAPFLCFLFAIRS